MPYYQMENLIDSLLLGIENRGTDATGIASVMPSGDLHIEKADLAASSFIRWRKDLPETPHSVLLHTRYATQGTPMNLNNNHPIRFNNSVAIHNGHISNDDEIFKEESLKRIAEVDSECIPALFDKYGIDKAHIPLGKLDGNFAVAVADLTKPGTLVLAKGWQSPLEYYITPNGIMWASTQKTITEAMKKTFGIEIRYSEIHSLGTGQMLYIEDGEIEQYPFALYKKPYTYKTAMQTASDNWQSQAWGDVIEEDDAVEDEDFSCLTTFAKMFNKKKQKKEMEESIDDAVSGKLEKSDKEHVEFWRSEPHEIAYTVITGDWTFIFKKCDDCETAYSTTLLNVTEEGHIFCDDCFKIFLEDEADHNAWKSQREKDEEDNPAVIHDIVVSQIAEDYGTTDIFVEWLLFTADEEEVGDTPELLNMFVQFQQDYEAFYDLLTGRDGSGLNNLSKIAFAEDAEIIEEEEIIEECTCSRGCWKCQPEPGNPNYDAWFASGENELSSNGAKTLAALRAAV